MWHKLVTTDGTGQHTWQNVADYIILVRQGNKGIWTHFFSSIMVHICIAFRSHVPSNPAVRMVFGMSSLVATKFSDHESLRSLRLGPTQTSRELHERTRCSGVTRGRCCFKDYTQRVTWRSRLGGPFTASPPGRRISLHCELSVLYLAPNKLSVELNLSFINQNLCCRQFYTHFMYCPKLSYGG